MLRYMLDTDICIYAIKNRPPQLRTKFNKESEFICISSVTLAELIYGAEKSERVERNLEVIDAMASRLEVLEFSSKAAAHFGNIRADLERAGTPIGAYDLMIAGHARSEGLSLVTNNEREFQRVDGLRIENWFANP